MAFTIMKMKGISIPITKATLNKLVNKSTKTMELSFVDN